MDFLGFFSRLLPIFGQTILPVFLVAAAGLLLASAMPVDGKSLGRVLFYLATPSLVFRSLYQLEADVRSVQHVAGAALIVIVVTGVLGWAVGIGEGRRRRISLVLTSSVSNNGNMGIPICLFAFGPASVGLASVYYVVSSFLTNTAGVVVASMGHAPLGKAILQALRVPVLYAAVGGLLFNRFGWELPVGVFRAIDLLAGAAVPCMLVLLGIQLRTALVLRRDVITVRSGIVRLLIGPLVAWGLCVLGGIAGLERNVLIVQAAMPTAVITSVLAVEYDVEPRVVAAMIFATTLFSMVTLSLILSLLL
jgi:predicted permease